MFNLSIQNLSSAVSDETVRLIAAALQWQADEHFNTSPWVERGYCPAVGTIAVIPKGTPIPKSTAHMEILDTSDQEGALGYHEESARRVFSSVEAGVPEGLRLAQSVRASAIPRKSSPHSSRGQRADAPHLSLSKVFAKTAQENGVAVSEVADHEALESYVDPLPMVAPRLVTLGQRIYIVEVGDPVQETPNYKYNGIVLANFVWPRYYGLPQSRHAYDQRLALKLGAPAMTPGGYISWAPKGEPNNWQQSTGRAAA